MKKKVLNPLYKFVYSSIAKDANKICESAPPKSEAHFVAFYFLMMCAKSKKLSTDNFQTLLYTIKENLTLNYSVFGVFRSQNSYDREQTAIKLSKYYDELNSIESSKISLTLRNEIALEYSKALDCELSFQDISDLKDTFISEKLPHLNSNLKGFVVLTLIKNAEEGDSKTMKFTPSAASKNQKEDKKQVRVG